MYNDGEIMQLERMQVVSKVGIQKRFNDNT